MSSFRITFFFQWVIFILVTTPASAQSPKLNFLGTYRTGIFDDVAAEVVSFDPLTKRLFFVNKSASRITALNISNPASPAFLFHIDVSSYGNPNSVAVKNGIVAVAIEAPNQQNNGKAMLYNTNGTLIKQLTVGAKPDHIIFAPDGNSILTADEGEPDDNYYVDPLGSVSIIDISGGIANVSQANVTTLTFSNFTSTDLDSSVRIFGPNVTIAKDLEPEYIAISEDSQTAWVALQENNAIAIIDIKTKTVKAIKGLGFKNHNQPGSGLDASNSDNRINIRPWPVYGIYEPDEMEAFNYLGRKYFFLANEGDSRTYSANDEEFTISKSLLDPTVFPVSDSLWLDKNLGRLKFSKVNGKKPGSSQYIQLYSFGARSFSIRDSACNLIWDSGDQFERIIASRYPAFFNANNTENTFDNRSNQKGCEPEGTTVGKVGDSLYAFIGLERMSGVMVYNITDPYHPYFVEYMNHRNFQYEPSQSNVDLIGDVGEEGLLFIPAALSPNNINLLISASEVSGTISVYSFDYPTEVEGSDNAFITEYFLSQNFPNPFNPTTNISYQIQKRGMAALIIFDALGREVKTLVNEDKAPGRYSVEFNASELPSGIYFYKLICSETVLARKCILLK